MTASLQTHAPRRIRPFIIGFVLIVLLAASAYILNPYSGTRVPAEAKAMIREERQAATKARAEQILAAVRAYQAQHNQLPADLTDLVPTFLPGIPTSMNSTMPFMYVVDPKKAGFVIKWEAFANSYYERYWLNKDGKLHADM